MFEADKGYILIKLKQLTLLFLHVISYSIIMTLQIAGHIHLQMTKVNFIHKIKFKFKIMNCVQFSAT